MSHRHWVMCHRVQMGHSLGCGSLLLPAMWASLLVIQFDLFTVYYCILLVVVVTAWRRCVGGYL